jgi:hypothetical protein
MQQKPRLHQSALAAALLGLALAACSDGGTGPSTGLTASQAQDVADVVTTDADVDDRRLDSDHYRGCHRSRDPARQPALLAVHHALPAFQQRR